jgi:CHAD domain-containing protein
MADSEFPAGGDMATAGKWIDGLTAATPVTDAARLVLGVRLQTVREFLDLSLRASEQDTEHVHQLRVGTRRAGAALKIFALCLPRKQYRQARKELRTMRRAAGEARDWDVFLEALGKEVKRPARQRPGLDFLFGHALLQREQAQTHLVLANPHFPAAFDQFQTETLDALRPPGHDGASLVGLARSVLGGQLQELTRAATQDLHDYEHLHQVRILGKRLRYAMEVFADCFAAEFRTVHYATVEEMQDILGRANDSHIAAQRLRALARAIQARLPHEWKRFRPGIEALQHFHEERLPEERQHFLEWWQRWQRGGGEGAFRVLLAQTAVTSSSASD